MQVISIFATTAFRSESLSAGGSYLPGAAGALGTTETSPLSVWAGLGWGAGAGAEGWRHLCRIDVFGCGVWCVTRNGGDSFRASSFVASEAV